MARKSKSLKSYTFNSVNPFISEMVESFKAKNKYKRIGLSTQDVVDYETGEYNRQRIVVLGKKEYLDSEEFTKVFTSQIGFFYELTKSDLKLFQYLLEKLSYNEDIVCVNYQKAAHDISVSIQTIYSSLSILIDRKIIARGNTNECYYINPKVFFKGDRLVIVNEYHKK